MNTLKKRLIGADDIAFDAGGTGEKDSYVSNNGKEYKVKRLNASDIPVTAGRREQYNGAFDVDTALKRVKEQVDSLNCGDFLQSDKTIKFASTETIEEIRTKINTSTKNLGGFTLKFVFPASLDQKLSKTLVFDGFFNGNLIISVESSTLLSGIYDLSDISSLFEIRNCHCAIEISNFAFIHQYSQYAIYLRGSLYIYIKNCKFTGNGDSIGICFDGSNGRFDNCSFYDDTDIEVIGSVVNTIKKIESSIKNSIEAVRTESAKKYLSISGGEMTGPIYLPRNSGLKTKHKQDMFIVAGESWASDAHITLRGQESVFNPGGVSICAGDGSSTKDLALFPEGDLLWDGKDITLGYPNYSSAVSLGVRSSYTAPSDGWIQSYYHGDEEVWCCLINGTKVFVGGGTQHDHSTAFLPVKKGDSVAFYDDEGDELGEAYEVNMLFIPNR